MFSFLVRNAQARNLLEMFWVAAVATVFIIRIFLYLTGYPQIGGSSFHIAHMLWGGLLMAAALIIMLGFLNREVKTIGAVIGGVGFGTFIDELGKFITHDNNYFFQPTILLLYLIFVGLFFLAKQIEIWFPLDKHEYLINSLELLKEVAVQDLDMKEKYLALQYLKNAQSGEELEGILLTVFNKIKPIPQKKDPLLIKITKKIDSWYKKLVHNRMFAKIIVFMFFLTSMDNLTFLVLPLMFPLNTLTFAQWGVLFSTLLSLFFIFQGAYYFNRKRRIQAFESLKIATYVSIFLVQLFLFYIEQLSAAVELFGALVALQVIQLILKKEKETKIQQQLT